MGSVYKWNKYEVVLLAEVYVNVKFKGADLECELLKLSQLLRAYAQNNGVEIDDVYRNLNGMRWQYFLLSVAFDPSITCSRKPSKLFNEIVDLYKNDIKEFNCILQEAHGEIKMLDAKNDNDKEYCSFKNWLQKRKGIKFNYDIFKKCIASTSDYAQSHGICNCSFWQITDFRFFNKIRNKLSGSRIFKLSDPKRFKSFEKIGKLYAEYLKETYCSKNCTNIASDSAVNTTDSNEIDYSNLDDKIIAIETEEYQDCEKQFLTVDYDQKIDYTFTSVKSVRYRENIINNVGSWKNAYTWIFCNLYTENKDKLIKLLNDNNLTQYKICCSTDPTLLRAPICIDKDFYTEANMNADAIIARIGVLLRYCSVPYEDVVIKYTRKDNVNDHKEDCLPPIVNFNTDTNIKTEDKPDNDSRSDFKSWLLQSGKFAAETAENYAKNIKYVNDYALKKLLISKSLFKMSTNELEHGINLILSNVEFARINQKKHHRFSASLKAFGEYALSRPISIDFAKVNIRQHDIDCPQELKGLLFKKFSYGIRINSGLEITKLRNLASMLDIEITGDDQLLKEQIISGGKLFDGKVYFVSDEAICELISKIQLIVKAGAQIIFYEEFYNKNFNWCDDNKILSWEILRELLIDKMQVGFCGKNYWYFKRENKFESQAIVNEVLRVWGDTPIRTYVELYEELPYIPKDKIRIYLSKSTNFVWSQTETFALVHKLIISETEKQEILNYVQSKCAQNGYVSICDIPLGNIEYENYEWTSFAIQEAIYNLILKDHFSLNNKKILTEKDYEIDAVQLVEAFCSQAGACTTKELFEFVESLNGTLDRQIAFRAAYNKMIRKDKDGFVSYKAVDFDVEAIDLLLEKYIRDDFTAIKNITTFAMFPPCGIPWNHFVLESFCYGFSNKFRLAVMNFNDKNVGIIYSKDVLLTYEEMLTVVLARGNIVLSKDIAGNYLFENGYLGKSKINALDRIVNNAVKLREEN